MNNLIKFVIGLLLIVAVLLIVVADSLWGLVIFAAICLGAFAMQLSVEKRKL
jgi:hypothetical protein